MTSPTGRPPADLHGTAHPPPPLPPRHVNAPTPCPDPLWSSMASHDPRSSSTQSLLPDDFWEESGRRKLLLVYIHGFMGNETSFQSFPAHVHNLISITLADSHVVHTKIYPRYRSRNALDFARDDFSKWLAPHENPLTDVVLLGHSMGGLVAADIALLFNHHIIGLVNFDVPFLGMHPGIIKAGLGSIFSPAPPPQHQAMEASDPSDVKWPSRLNTLFNPKPSDPNYNPSFSNDARLPVRKGWENALHFVNKHSNNLRQASKTLIKSHWEFGGAMADYRALKLRYAKVRALEEDDESVRKSSNPGVPSPPRIRFVNYYTASTGRPKKPKSPKSPALSRPSSRDPETGLEPTASLQGSQLTLSLESTRSPSISPRISVEEYRGDEVVPVSPEEPLSAISPQEDQASASSPSETSGIEETFAEQGSGLSLPEIPPIPAAPPFVDLATYTDKSERRAAEKEHSRALKDYQKAIKSRNAVIKERSKIEEKWQKQKQKQKDDGAAAKEDAAGLVEDRIDGANETDQIEEDLGAMALGANDPAIEGSGSSPYQSYDFSQSRILDQPHPDDRSFMSKSTASPTSYHGSSTTLATQDTNTTTPEVADEAPKKKRYRKFCMLPPRDSNGHRDPTWVQVFMENMDEVTAHTSLFFMSETYGRLVGEVGSRIEEWVREAQSMRLVRDLEGLD